MNHNPFPAHKYCTIEWMSWTPGEDRRAEEKEEHNEKKRKKNLFHATNPTKAHKNQTFSIYMTNIATIQLDVSLRILIVIGLRKVVPGRTLARMVAGPPVVNWNNKFLVICHLPMRMRLENGAATLVFSLLWSFADQTMVHHFDSTSMTKWKISLFNFHSLRHLPIREWMPIQWKFHIAKLGEWVRMCGISSSSILIVKNSANNIAS